jgi:tetrahydromethanopterin S-methyltransferase subunit G
MQHKFEESVLDDIKNMDQRLTELEEKIDSINTKLTQVVDAILGNPLTKTGGFINDLSGAYTRIDELEKQIADLNKKIVEQEEFKKKMYWVGGAVITILLVIQYVTNIYSNIKK